VCPDVTGGAPRLQAGDRVELVTVPPGRHQLHAGLRGVVLRGPEGAPWGLVIVQLGPGAGRPRQIHVRHLRCLEPSDATATED
jgi:hypothetical protein